MITTRRSELPPGPRLPRAAQTVGWIARPLPFLERCRERYGDVFTLRIQNEGEWVFLSDPDDVKRVFTGDPNVLRAGEANTILRPVVGSRSVLLLDEPQHMAHRKLMLPPFHGERMQRYGELMEQVTRAEVERWPLGEPFALWPRMQEITLEVIMRAVFGVTEAAAMEHLREPLRRMIDWSTSQRELGLLALLGPARTERRGSFRRVMRPVDEAVLGEIARRRAEPDLSEREDILSMLILARYEDGSQMSDRELRDELITLLVAGHETTATSLAWAFERLLRHPEKLERLRREVTAAADVSNEAPGDGSDADAPRDELEDGPGVDGGGDAHGEGSYVDAVVKETLRLRPVLPIVVRRLSEPMQFGGYTIPAGAALVPCIYLMHRREDLYPQPRAFLPERFLEKSAGTYTWIPFGGGVRRCLGASFAQFEMRQVLQTVLATVALQPARAESERVIRRSITLAPERQVQVEVVGRHGSPSSGRPLVGALV
jgi:cytochrome P450